MTSYVKTDWSAILKATFMLFQPEVSTTSGLKVMAHYVIFEPWPWIYPISKKKNLDPWSRLHQSGRSVQWCGLYIANRRTNMTNRQTDRQTDRLRFCKVTNRGDQYTLQKSTILQSNERIIGDFTFILILTDFDLWPRPLTLTVIYFCKKK